MTDILTEFFSSVTESPTEVLTQFPFTVFVLIFVPIFVWGFLFKDASSNENHSKSEFLLNLENQEVLEAKAWLKSAKSTPALWHIGVSAHGVSIVSEGYLRYFISTTKNPSNEDISRCVLMSMYKPINDAVYSGNEQMKPTLMAFNDFSIATNSQIEKLQMECEKFGIQVKKSLKDVSTAEAAEITKAKIMQQKKSTASSNDEKPDFNPTPPRVCYVCRKQMVDKKPSQCSACKAIIYCSADCAKKDWPQHKNVCPMFKLAMQSIETRKVHKFPFTFYTLNSPLHNFNAVTFLVREGLHNVGLYRRICQCYNQVPFGELVSESRKQLAVLDDEKAKFDSYCLPDELYPLNKTIEGKIDSWESFYKSIKLNFSSPIALIFEYPLTVYYILTQFIFPKGIPTDEPIEIHLLGVEKEVDLIPLFEILVGLLPKVNMTIRMVGPAIGTSIPEEHKVWNFSNQQEGGKLKIQLVSSVYTDKHYSGEAYEEEEESKRKCPDAVLLLNPALLAHESWVMTVKYLVEQKAKMVFTEVMEPNVHVMSKNLEVIGSKYSRPHVLNPFRQPVHKWTPDCNFPGFSNGFICFVNVQE